MNWLRRLLGLADKEPPPHVREGLDTAAAAREAAEAGRSAVSGYWAARAASERAREQAVLDEYDRVDQQVRGR